MKNYYGIIRNELRKNNINQARNRDMVLSLIFYKYACEKYDVSSEFKMENIILKNDEEAIYLLKEGIKELIPKNNVDKQKYEVFHDIFDLIDFENEDLIMMLKIILKVEIKDIDSYKDIFNEVFKRTIPIEAQNKLLANLVSNSYNNIKSLYNPNCDYGSLILQLNSIANVEMFYLAQNDFNKYILTKMILLVNGIEYNKFIIKNFNPIEYNLFDEKFQVSASMFPYYREKASNSIEVKYIEDSINHLEDDGIMGVVMFENNLYSIRQQNFRKFLIDNRYLSGVINLDNFSYKTGRRTVLLLKKNCENVLFINAEGKFNPRGGKWTLTEKEINDVSDIFKNKEEVIGKSKIIEYDEIKGNDYNLNLNRYVDIDPLESIDIGDTISNINNIKYEINSIRRDIKSNEWILIKTWLEQIKKSIVEDNFPITQNSFGCADLIVSDEPEAVKNFHGVYVYTSFVSELSSLIQKLFDILRYKYSPFILRFLGASTIDYIKNNPNDADYKGLLYYVVENVEKLVDLLPKYVPKDDHCFISLRIAFKDILSEESYNSYFKLNRHRNGR